MVDYFSPDGGAEDDYKGPIHKECPYCEGTGGDRDENDKLMRCGNCHGEGFIPLTDDEMEEDRRLGAERESDQNRD